MSARCSQDRPPFDWRFWIIYVALIAMLLAGCATTAKLPPERPEAVPVLIPIAKPCKVEKVEKSPLPSGGVTVPNDIFEAVKLALADRATALSDREKLLAANSDPCQVK